MTNTEFIQSHSVTSLVAAIIFVIFALIIFKKYNSLGVFTLIVSVFFIGLFIASLDPFLNIWDEQYHALVAKNLSKDLLTPKLYSSTIFEAAYTDWTSSSIWLHKQPLFLWQIALSIKVFGTNALAVRIPSIIMHAILPYFIYRIGKITYSKETGFYGALLFGFAFFPLELLVGKYSTDHNDLAFLFYVTASFWAWFEYKDTQKKYWLLLIGLFSGCAVLVKWLMGLLVFVAWLITKSINKPEKILHLKSYSPLITSSIFSFIIFIPWQIYITKTFPEEAFYEYNLNSKHFMNVVEGHGGKLWFHFTDALGEIYGTGDLIPFLILLSLLLFLKNIQNLTYKILIIVTVIFVYSFYSVAKTKMIAFTLITSPFIFISLGFLLDFLLKWMKQKRINSLVVSSLSLLIPLFIAFSFFDLNKIKFKHTNKEEREAKMIEQQVYEIIKKEINESYVVFNCSITLNGEIPTMFYTNCIAYGFIPNEEQIKMVFHKKKNIAIINNGHLPEYITNNSNIFIIDISTL